MSVTFATTFLAPPSLPATLGAPEVRAPSADRPEQRLEFGATAGLATAACALALAGAAKSLRRRSGTTMRVLGQPIPVINWQVDPKTPVPGSEKALQTMVGTDVEMGEEPWDPMGFSKLYDRNFDLKKLQLQELKNGRLAMIGVASLAANHAIPGSVPLLSGLYAEKPDAPEGVSPAFCGATRTGAVGPAPHALAPTAARYTTKKVLPAFQWLKTGVKASQLAPGQLVAKILAGNDVLVGKDQSGSLFCVGNLCPHFGTPMSEGADVIGDIIVCPLHGSSFSVKTGELIDWCPSPPIIGPLTGIITEPRNLPVLEARTSFFGDDVEVNVDTNAKKAYEADYWKGLLDAQGKVDGTYY